MSLDEEIAIYQFGQGISPANELLDHFTQLNEYQQKILFYALYRLVSELSPVESDFEQALSVSQLGPGYTPCIATKGHRLPAPTTRAGRERDYTFLLHLFQTVYQRRYTLNDKTSARWHDQDLTDAAFVQNLLDTHHALQETIYTAPDYRSEFLSLAKLWHDRISFPGPDYQEPEPEPTNRFHFLKYDDLVTASINSFSVRNARAITILRHSLEKALKVRYKLHAEQVRRLILEILERHLREKYNSPLF